ncbi:hypothetical protein [Legionella bononiensis]|uniref:hypothetical protein n=1 Tax=Legionella bononiensis TaxID=2793102 RepID=UPI001932E9AD|nr:hypothetical protein [Legionella bononiensis]MBL7480605.1 hypothetical protein [Legionella bononiensis]
MFGFKRNLLLIALSCLSYQAIATIDPVAQSLIPETFPSTVTVGDSLSANYTLTNNKKFPVKLTITSTSVGNGIVVQDRCNGTTLAKKGAIGSQCTINISMDPTTAGPLSWTGVMHYDFNAVPLTPIRTTVIEQTGQVKANTDIDLPAESVVNHSPYPFTFRFTNTGASPVTGNGQVTANVSSFEVDSNNCINKTLAPNEFCLITGNFTPLATGFVRIQGSFQYSGGKFTATAATETIVRAVTGQVTARTEIPLPNPTYVNQGPYSFLFKFTNNGSTPVIGTGVFNAHGAPVTHINDCINKTLQPTQFCTIRGTFSPVQTGDVTLNGDFIYDSGTERAATSAESTVINSSGLIGQVISALPSNAAVNTNYPVEFRFTNSSTTDLTVTQQLSLPNVGGIVNHCPNGGVLSHVPPANVCTISGTFNSGGSAAVQTLIARLTPSTPQVPPAEVQTQTLTQPTNSVFVALWPLSLRVSAGAVNMPYQFNYQINNNLLTPSPVTVKFVVPSTVTLVQQAPTAPPSDPNDPYFKSYYNCGSGNVAFDPNQNLSMTIPANPGGVCNIYVTFLVTATVPPNAYTDNFTMSFINPSPFPNVVTPMSYATGNAITANGTPLTRTINFTNHCNYSVYYALHGASVQAKNQSSVSCNVNSDCFTGSSCVNNECQWIQPSPTNGFLLAPNGGTTSVVIPMYDNAIKLNLSQARDVTWGGNLAGRVGCTAGVGCTVNDCGLDTGGAIGKCSTGIGSARSPISASEFTLQADDPLIYSNQTVPNLAADNYNVQLIDGITVPSTMTPSNGVYSAPYSCGGAGLKTLQGGSTLSSCSWTFNPPDANYPWVQYSATPTPCTVDNDCLALPGTICGLMVNPSGNASFNRACGLPAFSGQSMYWTADAVCKIQPTYNQSPFFCSNPVSTIPGNVNTPNTTLISTMYACTGPQLGTSCYGSTQNTCCGCSNWPTSPVGTEPCGAINPGWTQQVLGKIQWTKTGCPTAYAFPYDDASSSFTCLVNEVLTVPQDSYDGNVNTTNYEIEFCPQ